MNRTRGAADEEVSDADAAITEWLDRELSGRRVTDPLLAELVARHLPGVDPVRAQRLLRDYRYSQRVAERCHQSRDGVISYDPAAMGEMISEEEFGARMGWGAGEGAKEQGGEEWCVSMAQAAGVLLGYLKKGLLKRRPVRRFWKERLLRPGEIYQNVGGPGEAAAKGGSVEWLIEAVVVRRGEEVMDVYPDARVRGRQKRKHGEAIIIERWALEEGGLDFAEMGRRVAAMLRLYLGSGSGLRSQAHLAKAGGVTKQAVGDMELRMARFYREQTGGRAQFEGVRGKGPKKRITGGVDADIKQNNNHKQN